MNEESNFTVFCLENYKEHLHSTGKETVKLFRDYGVFDYIREFYDVLHTTSSDYINNDIDIYLAARGCPLK